MNTKILPSNIHGLGLFAIVNISKGDTIEQPDKIDLSNDIDKWIKYNRSGQKKSFAYSSGYCIVNHSDTPNTKRGNDFEIIAKKDILIGEEITENYNELPDNENPFKNTIEQDMFHFVNGV